ncbi:HTH-type transcriptional regulator HdfR [Parendozoicomonas haliclonae]|uniref:HTH-type transcriptional regulator YofA n=1 Tax=Parendozoicomonas haliclonae TaxID=1960125 RepID=A0A1X7AQ07_9GAMM|nr:HTH-type transcriptional regulator HdfR [Parendozoicomonas haliclonae]SMA50394.1 HTH-type transcriptional regulator YofA [Parendozoicomonas haliclonae]
MDTDLLKTFLEVSRTRHFGKAAENLYLTQSAVSARIRQLEALLNSPLFERTRHNIRLTSAGERLLPHAESILTALHRARQDVALHQTHQQQIAIGATANVWDILLQERVTALLATNSSRVLRAESLSAETLPRRLLERTLDLCVMFDPPKVDELACKAVKTIDMVLVTTEAKTSDWLPSEPDDNWIMIDWGTRFGSELARALPELPLPILQTNSLRIAMNALHQTNGCAYLPANVVASELERGELFIVDAAPVLERHIYAAWHQDSEYQTTLDELIAELRLQA